MVIVACIATTGCTPRSMVIDGVANQLAGQGQMPEEDLGLLRESSAFYLKLSEAVLRRTPGHLNLAESVTRGFTQYAYAFVAFEAEKLESTDAASAFAQRARAARLYLRAHAHAMTALETTTPGFRAALAHADAKRWPKITRDQVGVAYWAAAAWGGYISLATGDAEAVVELPLAARLAALAYRTDPAHAQGGLLSLLGQFETARPGGSSEQARIYFDQAIEAARGRNAGVFIAKAEALALPAGDHVAFVALLEAALRVAQTHRSAANEALRERARWQLARLDDLF